MMITQSFRKCIAFAFVLMAFTFVACKDDEKEPDPVLPASDPIVATWQLSTIAPEVAGTSLPQLAFVEQLVPCLYQLKITFKADATLSTADCDAAVTAIGPFVPVTSNARWKVEGDNLTLTAGSTTQTFKKTQTDTTLTLVVNTETDASKPAKNALLTFKKV